MQRTMMTRRFGRGVVLALLLVGLLLGPWGSSGANPMYFAELVHDALWTMDLLTVYVALTLAVRIACLWAILASSRTAVVAYRVAAWVTAVPMILLLLAIRPPLERLLQIWGATLYLAALLLVPAAEFLGPRKTRQPKYSDVFN